jgi:hypothetical protein
MESIKLNGKDYPIRFDFRALKEYKSKTKNDVLVKFDSSTDNIITLSYCSLKSGALNNSEEFGMSEEDVSKLVTIKDMMLIVAGLKEELGISDDDDKKESTLKPGEASGTA